MNLTHYNKSQLTAIITHITDEHPYLAAEVTKFARAAGYDEVNVKDFKTQTRELIKTHVRGSYYRNSSVKALVKNWLPVLEQHFTQIEAAGDCMAFVDYAIFVWQQAQTVTDRADHEPTMAPVTELIEGEVTGSRAKITALGPVKVKRIVAKYIKAIWNKKAQRTELFWLDESLALVQDANQLAQIQELVAIKPENDDFGFKEDQQELARLVVKLHQKPETINYIAQVALTKPYVFDWYVHYLLKNNNLEAAIALLEHSMHYKNLYYRQNYRELLDRLYQQQQPDSFVDQIMRSIRANDGISDEAQKWLQANPDGRHQLVAELTNPDSKTSADFRLNGLLQLHEWAGVAAIIKADPTNKYISVQLDCYRELHAAGLTDVKPLIRFFVTGMAHAQVSTSDRSQKVAQSIAELAAISGDDDLYFATAKELVDRYPRKQTLHYALAEWGDKLHGKFRRHSLYSAARYAFDHEWLDTWEKADK